MTAVAWLIVDRLLTPAVRRPSGTTPSASGELTDVKGIGAVYAGRLADAGITDVAALAAADPARVADVLGTSPERASGFVAQAKRLTRS